MKKFITMLLAASLAVCSVGALTACGKNEKVAALITLHGDNSSYDKNFIDAFKAACEAKGLSQKQYTIVSNIPEEGDDCYNKAAGFADEGYKVVFADSFGHEANMLKAAKEYKDTEFCHATGTMAHTEKLPNFHNAFASIYEGRYLAGVAAGMKLNAMIEAGEITAEQAKMGYVGAFTYAEVISGYPSFYLGAKSVCPSVTMDVQFTGSWYDETAERTAAETLINQGCVIISQHADSMGAPSACEDKGIPNISYNGSTQEHCPNTFIVSSRIDWAPYFKYICEQNMKGEAIATDWTGTIATGSVVLTDVNTAVAAAGTVEELAKITEELKNGTRNVFDTANFTVGGSALTSYKADVDTDAAFEKDTEVIENGVFFESKFRSAPYFDLQIDGIKLLNTNFG